jgi:hypothetical protein
VLNAAEVGITTTETTLLSKVVDAACPPGIWNFTFIGQFWTAAQIDLRMKMNGALFAQVKVMGGADYQTQAMQASVYTRPGQTVIITGLGSVGAGMRAGSHLTGVFVGDPNTTPPALLAADES